MTRKAKTVSAPRAEARLYLAKATQFAEEARAACAAARNDAALLSAIHAGISAADAVSVALSGRRSADPDHARVLDLLEEIAANSPELAVRIKQLAALLGMKNRVEYESRRATVKEATDAAQRAARLVEWAEEVVTRAKL